ncbi:MAG: hypothetical protein OZ921_08700 [Sorangiineae bacterium]|nr:hypothetical protein [Polyangiaceae bacterium]MEB2322579.1 hypothetical protein [Sorangiineae bacterium]
MTLALEGSGHSPIDVVNLVAVVFGVMFSYRRLNVSRRPSLMYPEVPEGDFEYWKSLEMSGWNLGAIACVLKIAADFAFRYAYVERAQADWRIYGPIGFLIFASWIVAMVIAALRLRKGRIVRAALGIDLDRPIPLD